MEAYKRRYNEEEKQAIKENRTPNHEELPEDQNSEEEGLEPIENFKNNEVKLI